MFVNKLSGIVKNLPPEWAHFLVIKLLKYNLIPSKVKLNNPILHVKLWNKTFTSPIGLAAGFDKNAESINGLFNQGFSFVEAGTVTLQPQRGNMRPRLFRLSKDQAVINRLGFNNKGINTFLKNIKSHIKDNRIIGINIGKNKYSENNPEEYCELIKRVYNYASYITINISSPNTPNLRALQKKSALEGLVEAALKTRESLTPRALVPLLIKISPDINNQTKKDIAFIALNYKIDGLILTNTTTGGRNHLIEPAKVEFGGLSGRPLFNLSNKVLKEMYQLTEGKIPLIGCGGVSTAQQAYAKIKNGASLIQIYTGIIYQGFEVINEINRGVVELLKADGFNSISEAIGSAHK